MAAGIILRFLRRQERTFSSLMTRPFCSWTARNDNVGEHNVVASFYRAQELSLEAVASEHIGIDFGSTNIGITILDGNYAKVIHKSPSLVAFADSEKFSVGTFAKTSAVNDPKNAFSGIKRLICKKFDHPDIQKEMKVVSYKILRAPDGYALLKAYDKLFTPTRIAQFILQQAKIAAESYIGKSVFKAIITFPTGLAVDQINAIQQAGLHAGLDLQAGVTEPIAAAISYGLINKEALILVFDLGGKSLKISILKLSSTGNIFTKASSSDNFLGGEDFNNTILDYLVSEFKRTEAIDLTNDNLAIHTLRDAAEKAKIELSSSLETEIYLPFVTGDASGAKHLNIRLTKSKFECLVNGLIERTRITCERCLEEAGKTAEEVDEVLLIGGMARVPKVQEVVTKILGKEPSKGVNPEDAIALGAAAEIEAGLVRRNVWKSLSNNEMKELNQALSDDQFMS